MTNNPFPISTLKRLPEDVLKSLSGAVKGDYDKECCPHCETEIPAKTLRGESCINCDAVLFDLFEFYDRMPKELDEVCDFFSDRAETAEHDGYILCEQFLEAVKILGFTFDYELDAQPFALRVDLEALKIVQGDQGIDNISATEDTN